MKRLLYAALCGLFLMACEGPEGKVGPQGAQGPQGVAGTNGAKGDPGNPAGALQISWGGQTTNNDGSLILNGTINGIAAKSIEKGSFNCYVKSENYWFQIPQKILINSTLLEYIWFYVFGDNEIAIALQQIPMAILAGQNSDGSSKVVFQPLQKVTFQDVRLVIVPAQNARLSAEIDWTDYETVRKTFNLPE